MSALSHQRVSVRLPQATKLKLELLATATGKSQGAVVDQALALLEDDLFWAGMDAGYAKHGEAIQADLQGADGGLLDGVEDLPA